MPEFLKTDMSTILVSLMRLNYFPASIFEQLNLMSSLSTFNKEDCLRMLDTMFRFQYDDTNPDLKTIKLHNELVEKLFQQVMVLSHQMDDRNLTRALSILSQ